MSSEQKRAGSRGEEPWMCWLVRTDSRGDFQGQPGVIWLSLGPVPSTVEGHESGKAEPQDQFPKQGGEGDSSTA